MKVLYGHCLSDTNHPAARMVHSIAVELRKLGDDVVVHEPEVPWRLDQGSKDRKPAAAKRFQRLRNMVWFAKTLRHDRRAMAADVAAIQAYRPDVVLARHDAYRGSLVRAARTCGVPVVVYADAPVAHETRHWSDDSAASAKRFHPPGLVENYEKHHLAMSSAIVAVSEPGRKCLQAYGLEVPITVIRNGVDQAFLGELPDRERKRQLRLSIGIDAPYVAGFVGTFKPFHGTALLADLIVRTSSWSDLHWLLVGDGPRKPEFMRTIGQSVRTVTDLGRQPAERLPELYRMLDFSVAPYPPSQHPFHFCPLKILEAEASGAVVLASARGDIPALLGEGTCGVVVPDDTVETWIECLRKLMNDPDRSRFLSGMARASIENQHTWSIVARNLRIILKSAAESGVTKQGNSR